MSINHTGAMAKSPLSVMSGFAPLPSLARAQEVGEKSGKPRRQHRPKTKPKKCDYEPYGLWGSSHHKSQTLDNLRVPQSAKINCSARAIPILMKTS